MVLLLDLIRGATLTIPTEAVVLVLAQVASTLLAEAALIARAAAALEAVAEALEALPCADAN